MSHSSSTRLGAFVIIALTFAAACGGNDAAPDAGADSDSVAGGPGVAGGQGAELYQRCVVCHQPNGEGVAGAFPPLTGSEWVTGNPSVPIRIVLHGMQGPITVKDQQFNSVMLAYGTGQPMTDAEVASVLTYVRSSFGNNAPAITDAQVATERAATSGRTTPWNAGELEAMLK